MSRGQRIIPGNGHGLETPTAVDWFVASYQGKLGQSTPHMCVAGLLSQYRSMKLIYNRQ